jgi:biopolymer transport protein ExbB
VLRRVRRRTSSARCPRSGPRDGGRRPRAAARRSTATACCCRWSKRPRPPARGTLESGGHLASQLTRRLRDALHRGLAHLQFGQVLLASIGSTAPFVGLFGTVWGIYHALVGIAAAGSDVDREGRRARWAKR